MKFYTMRKNVSVGQLKAAEIALLVKRVDSRVSIKHFKQTTCRYRIAL